MKRINSGLKKTIKYAAKLLKHQLFWVVLLMSTTFLIAIYFLIPDTKNISAPAIVASTDSGKLIPLKIIINPNHDLVLRFDLTDLLYVPWTTGAVQKTENSKDVRVVINGKSSDSFRLAAQDSIILDRGDNYFHFEKRLIEKYFDLRVTGRSVSNEFYIEYVSPEGFYPRNYSSSFISLLYIPVDYNSKTDSLLNLETEVELETPHNYIVTSSIPDPDKIFVLERGVNYSFKFKRKETGIFITLENISATGLKEIIMLLITTVFSFALGFAIEKWIQERKFPKGRRD